MAWDLRTHRANSMWITGANLTADQKTFILSWWSKTDDEILLDALRDYKWYWLDFLGDEILSGRLWKHQVAMMKAALPSPRQSYYAYESILTNFLAVRFKRHIRTVLLPEPQMRRCRHCRKKFIETSYHLAKVKMLGLDCLVYCNQCMYEAERDPSLALMGKPSIIEFAKKLHALTDRVPSQDYGYYGELLDFAPDNRVLIIDLLLQRPPVSAIRKECKSWFEVLVASGILEGDAQRMVLGTRCLAKDGHVCNSLGEREIDDVLFRLKIPHEKEPPYPEGGQRADFKVGRTLIEYFGLITMPEYRKKADLKIKLCAQHGVRLIAVYPKDLVRTKTLEGILAKATE